MLLEAERIVNGYNQGRIKQHSLNHAIYGHGPYGFLPAPVEAAFLHAAAEHRAWLVAGCPAHRGVLDGALLDLVRAVDAEAERRNVSDLP
jgi:hypothetical protein